jgi:hypothetical protein
MGGLLGVVAFRIRLHRCEFKAGLSPVLFGTDANENVLFTPGGCMRFNFFPDPFVASRLGR